MSAQIYRTLNSDGVCSVYFCDGKSHFDRSYDEFEHPRQSTISAVCACDGSCKPESRMIDLRKRLAEARMNRVMDLKGKNDLPSAVHLDAAMTAMFATNQPIVGVEFASMYAKRSYQSNDFCLGTLHVHWHESDDWNRVRNAKTCATYQITTLPCDGSCCKTTRLSRGEKRSLRKQERDRKVWDAEWAARYLKSA